MNERIKELLTPKLKEWGGASGDNFSEELEKFADLILEDVMQELFINGYEDACDFLIELYGVEE